MILKIKQLWRDKFVRGTMILTATTFLSSVFNFLVHPILTRYLSISEYGDFQALLSFITVFGIVSAVIYMTFTREIAALVASRPEAISSLRWRSIRSLSLVGLALFILILIFSGPLNELFNISQASLLVISSLTLLYTYPLFINRATLAGFQRFPTLAAVNISDSSSRLILVILLVVVWSGGISGAAWALGLTSLIGLFLSFWAVKRLNLSKGEKTFQYSWRLLGSYAVLVLWFTALSQFFYNFDMLFVKAHFSPEEAGLYGALLTVGRIIYFVGGSVPLVMFPVIAGLKNDSSPRRFFVLLKSLGLMALLAGPACLVIALWPELMISLVVGGKYLSVVPYLPLFSLVILLLTMLTVLSQYFLALAKRRGLIVLTLGAVAEAVFLFFFRADFWQIIWSLLIVFALVNLTLVVLILYEYLKNRSKGRMDELSSHQVVPEISGLNQGSF